MEERLMFLNEMMFNVMICKLSEEVRLFVGVCKCL